MDTDLVPIPDSFVKPHYIEELGEEGLTAAEIAKAMGVEVDNVRQKLNRGWAERTKRRNSFILSNVMMKNINGLEFYEWVLNTKAAKKFVGQYQSDAGDAYFEFLLECEDVAVKLYPQVVRELKASRQEEYNLRQRLKELPAAKKPHGNKGRVWASNPQIDVFGNLTTQTQKLLPEQTSSISRKEGLAIALGRISSGMSKKSSTLMQEVSTERRQ